MLTLLANELSKDDLDDYEIELSDGEYFLRFCYDFQHEKIILCREDEDHIVGAENLLATELDLSELSASDIANKIVDHIVGGGIYFRKGFEPFLMLGGSSTEQSLSIHNLKHTAETMSLSEAKLGELFGKFYGKIQIKVVK